MKKVTCLFLALAMILGAIGCATTPTETATPVTETAGAVDETTDAAATAGTIPDDQKIVVSFASQWFSEEGRADFIYKAAETFEKENPQYKFEGITISYGDFNDKMKVAFASGETPTIVYCIGDWLESWYEQGWIAPMDDYVDINGRKDDFAVWSAQEAAQRDGKNYGLNIETCPYGGLIYNKAILEAEGITEIPTTPEEFLALAKKLTHDDQYGFIAANSSDNLSHIMQESLPWIMGFGGIIADKDGNFMVNSPEFVKGVEYYRELATTCAPKSMVYNTQRQLFFEGKAAMCADGGYFVTWAESTNPDLTGKLDVAYLPLPTKANNTDIVYVCLSSAATEEQKVGAGKFLEVLMRDEFQQNWLSGCNYPVMMKSGITDEYRANNPWVGIYEDLAANGISGEVSGHETSSDEIRKIIAEYIVMAIEDPTSDVQKLMDECKQKLEEI